MNHVKIFQYSLIIAVLCMMLAQVTVAAPQIEFVGGPTFNFGGVEPNATLTHEFVFKNTGDEVLEIIQVKGG